MDTYSQALRNYHEGKEPNYYQITRDDGYSTTVPVSIFFDTTQFSDIELLALNQCKGKILDVGAGAGRHSLELQRRKADITALDISQTSVDIMRDRGIKEVIHSDVMELRNEQFDTLLMLMNGIGMVGVPEKLDCFLEKAKQLLTKEGIIIFDSIDVSKTNNIIHEKYRCQNISNYRLAGQQKFRISYDGVAGEFFDWLHISYEEMSKIAQKHGYSSELLELNEKGQYVAKLEK